MSQATPASISYTNSNLFSGYYLDERVDSVDAWDCDEEARAVFRELRELWDAERDLVRSYNENELLGSWIDPVLGALGYDSLAETTLPDGGGYNDRLLFDSPERRREAASEKRDGRGEETYRLASALLEAKQWNADFTERFADERSYRDASHQVKYYLERTPDELGWGVLTNGRTWRLYGTKEYETSTYYEVDLVHLLESGDLERFKYFYVFFRSAAFRGSSGETFLDRVWAESESAAQQLGEDLQDNVFTALGVLGTGFAETNTLEIDPGDTARLDELKEQSLVLLYRLMFVLYAESRDLIDPDDAHTTEYEENFSLDRLRREIVSEVGDAATERAFEREYSTYATGMWSRLEDLFALIDEGNADLGIPPYNGGLFDRDSHEFLVANQVADRYLAEVIYRLSTTETPEGFVPAEYADLDTRHLGSIYEGLLEHEFRVASEEYAAVSEGGNQVWKPGTEVSVADAVETVEKGELYVVNDDGERKATGAYYTPDYVVTYIVEETLGPLVEEIDADLRGEGLDPDEREYFRRFWARVTDLKVLDPAMGSGHFLTRATGYLTEQVMSVVREQEIQSYDEDDLRRQIAKECIYGVDLNGMAVELAKLSMWLETLAADQPLAFLDHHLKTGNSLVGSDITEVLSDGDEQEDGQLTFAQVFARTRKRALEHVMELMEDLLAIDNETLADVKSMEEIYQEIRADPLYRRLFAMANVHTAERFGCEVPGDAYERMARAVEEEAEWAEIESIEWFREAQELANEEKFFHWELEFPEVFFGGEGMKMEAAGFDAVIGNPPYVRQEQLRSVKPYLETSYDTYRGVADLYVYFIEQGGTLLRESGRYGNIVSNKFTRAEYGTPLRSFLKRRDIEQLIDFGSLPVFPNATAYPLILLFENTEISDKNPQIAKIKSLQFDDLRKEVDRVGYLGNENSFNESGWSLSSKEVAEVLSRVKSSSTRLQDYINESIYYGLKTGLNDAFFLSEKRKEEIVSLDSNSEEIIEPLAVGNDIDRYAVENNARSLILMRSGWTTQESGIDDEREAWNWLQEHYPGVADHLEPFKQKAKSRYDKGEFWWELRPCDYYEAFEQEKIVYPVIAKGPRFAIDDECRYLNDKCFLIPQPDYALLGVLNSTLTDFWVRSELSGLRGGFQEFRAVHIQELPIPLSEERRDISDSAQTVVKEKQKLNALNLSLLDHLGNYDADGPTLTEIGFTQPPAGAADSILQETVETREKLRVGSVEIEREGDNSVTIRLSARYKPDEEGDHETDRWGYTETDLVPALRITDLSATDADLICAFVPVAVEEAEGFAGFRETATKTNSLVDRLEKLTLPVVSEVEDGLANYIETKARAEELEGKIERTDQLIDEIVYELYGLTDEEIEIVEDTVGD